MDDIPSPAQITIWFRERTFLIAPTLSCGPAFYDISFEKAGEHTSNPFKRAECFVRAEVSLSK